MAPWFTTLPFLMWGDFRAKPGYHAARFEKDSRYYTICLSRDLFNDWVIMTINGRIKSKLGQSRTHAFASFNEAFAHFFILANLRHQRHYQLIDIRCDNWWLLELLPWMSPADKRAQSMPVHNRKPLPRVAKPKATIVTHSVEIQPSQLAFAF